MNWLTRLCAWCLDLIRGPEGLQGEQGPKGVQGHRGTQGDMGPVGARGAKGERGIEGERGVRGAQGSRGEKGLPGPPGPRGGVTTESPPANGYRIEYDTQPESLFTFPEVMDGDFFKFIKEYFDSHNMPEDAAAERLEHGNNSVATYEVTGYGKKTISHVPVELWESGEVESIKALWVDMLSRFMVKVNHA